MPDSTVLLNADPKHPAAPPSFLPQAPCLSPFRRGGGPQRAEDCTAVFTLRGSAGILQKTQKSTGNFRNYPFSKYFLSICYVLGLLLDVTDTT